MAISQRKVETRLVHSVCAIVLKGNWVQLLRSQVVSGLTSSTLDHILTLVSFRSCFLSLSFFTWLQSLPHFQLSLQTYWTMIHLLTKRKKFNSAKELLERITFKDSLASPSVLSTLLNSHDEPVPNSQILSWLVISYARSRMIDDAVRIFEEMKARRLTPHVHACSALLSAIAKARLTDMAWKVYHEMLRIGMVPNLHIFNVMIHACYKSGDAEKAENFFNEMEGKGIRPDLYTYNTLIALLCKKGMHYEALGIQERMVREGIKPDIITYNSLIYGYCREGDMGFACTVRTKMVEAGLILDQFTYKAFIHGFCKVQDLIKAKEVLYEMLEAGLRPSYAIYSWIVDGYCKENNPEAVLRIPEELKKRGLCADFSVYRSLLRRLCKRGMVDYALKLFSCMKAMHMSGDALVYSNLACACFAAGKSTMATEILDEMVKSHLRITPKIYSCLNASFGEVSWMQNIFWTHSIEKGLITKNVYKVMTSVFEVDMLLLTGFLSAAEDGTYRQLLAILSTIALQVEITLKFKVWYMVKLSMTVDKKFHCLNVSFGELKMEHFSDPQFLVHLQLSMTVDKNSVEVKNFTAI
ncbi:hypothetical protein H6P81_012726 [Aristolochia fimbriata]|uniref:Pentatricopeptide repeat-containing protein n=1 Tax=Aristolochia fimbriata TaxID=158543 RepID=A0AAV7EHA1_ARIFI|nr:hypothetical protein H6P81_012726 [Aristolochia fimbriata]